MDRSYQIQWMITKQYEGLLIREFLLKYKGISKRALTAIKFNGGEILLNGQDVTVRERLHEGDSLTIKFPRETVNDDIIPENISLDIVYEDEHILVINKPANMATIPSREHQRHTLANGLKYYYEHINLPATIHIVNRLDRDTSGLLIVAKNSHVHHLFSIEQRKHTIHREYEAVVHGTIDQPSGCIEAPIGRKETSIIEREVRDDGQYALTHYTIIKTLADWTWVSLKLETGRTHQIRVHMSSIGHPLVGDELYGGTQEQIGRQALHSKALRFYHPFLKKEMKFIAPLPDDMKKLIN